jgi:hypothetical protein
MVMEKRLGFRPMWRWIKLDEMMMQSALQQRGRFLLDALAPKQAASCSFSPPSLPVTLPGGRALAGLRPKQDSDGWAAVPTPPSPPCCTRARPGRVM